MEMREARTEMYFAIKYRLASGIGERISYGLVQMFKAREEVPHIFLDSSAYFTHIQISPDE